MLYFAFATHKGYLRQRQEDAYGHVGEELFVVTDGLGGLPGGKEAANLAVVAALSTYQQAKKGEVQPKEIIRQLVRAANRRILHQSQSNPSLYGMSTTMVVALVQGQKWWLGNVGDSRGYFFSKNRLKQITQDHEDFWGTITRVVGLEEEVAPDIFSGEATIGDTLLLATDGLFGVVDEDRIKKTIIKEEGNLQNKADGLIKLALNSGGPDNVTVCLVKWLNG